MYVPDEYVSNSSTIWGCFNIWHIVASRLRSSRLNPGLEVNLATSTILTANCSPVCRWIHRRTKEKGPLPRIKISFMSFISFFYIFIYVQFLGSLLVSFNLGNIAEKYYVRRVFFFSLIPPKQFGLWLARSLNAKKAVQMIYNNSK